jgi:hypothetical protein
MRIAMIRNSDPVGGIFIGGMSGVVEEWSLFGDLHPRRPRIPISAPGGAAATLKPPPDLVRVLGDRLQSRGYPVLAHAIVGLLADEASRGR